jgi:predicted secreted protein
MPTDADRTADYKGFTIRTFKTDNGLWRAIITKADGSKIKAAGQNESFDLIPVQLNSIQPDKALEEVKRLIDAGGMT